jgi:hypothetical protein
MLDMLFFESCIRALDNPVYKNAYKGIVYDCC